MTVNIITLGCSKNLVDSERLLLQFRSSGHRILHDDYSSDADLVIINTCGFILDAKQESIDTILFFLEAKKKGSIGKVFVMGCLSERYRKDLQDEMPGVDGFYGVWEMDEVLRGAGSGLDRALINDRVLTTPSHYAYLKVAEGCNRTCSFCAIPLIRGKQRSVSIEDLAEEGAALADRGVKELILIAQDLTSYGTDIYGKKALPELLEELVKVPSLEWIRLHYAYPAGFPEAVLDLMASQPKICPYLDIPIQHINDRVLSAMGRGLGRKKTEELLSRFRSIVPDMAIRTTLLTGFPGEDEQAFNELMEFVASFRFDRLGVFPYSHEEDTPAFEKFGDAVPEEVKLERVNKLMELQQQISMELNQERVGRTYRVVIDRKEGNQYIGRTRYDSPEVDNEVLVTAVGQLEPGSFQDVIITGAEAFDLFGTLVQPGK